MSQRQLPTKEDASQELRRYDAGTHLIDTLLKRRAEDLARKREKWLQVAGYVEHIATLIEGTIAEYKQGSLPHQAYA